jgi:hypothetical protein
LPTRNFDLRVPRKGDKIMNRETFHFVNEKDTSIILVRNIFLEDVLIIEHGVSATVFYGGISSLGGEGKINFMGTFKNFPVDVITAFAEGKLSTYNFLAICTERKKSQENNK